MKKLYLQLLIVCWCLLSVFSMSAQEKLSIKAMQEDIDYYFNAIKEMHPHPYAKYTESQLDSVKLQLYKDCSQPMSLFDFNFLLAKTSRYTDGHTGVYSPQYNLTSDEKDNLFPPVKFKEGEIFLNGCIVQSINGIPSSKILQELDGLVSWERHPICRENRMNYYLSPLLYRIFHLSTPFVCSIKDKESDRVHDSIVEPIKEKEYLQAKKINKYYTVGALPYELFSKDSIAIIFYNTSSVRGNKSLEKAIDKFTKDFFEQIKEQKIKYLFIDVSQNGGGNDNVHQYFFRFIKTKPYQYTKYYFFTLKGGKKYIEDSSLKESGCKTKEELPNDVQNKLNQNYAEFEKQIKKLLKKGEMKHKFKFKGNKTGFDGKVFIIMGNNTYSAANDFCEQAKWSKAGILVGEESGQRSPYSGNTTEDKLPNSKIAFRFAATYDWTEPSLPNKDGFLQPDIPYDLSRPLGIRDYKEIICLSNELKSNR